MNAVQLQRAVVVRRLVAQWGRDYTPVVVSPYFYWLVLEFWWVA